jgi:2,4-dienoyl-CoA reductase-like NADH-dependent reductase (Old Yellow Enzyme family)
MSTNLEALFQPFRVKSLSVANRIVMAPMTRMLSPGGVPTANDVDYYRLRGEDGVGLIITEATTIDRAPSVYHPHVPQFHGESALAGWRSVLDAVHAAGSKMAPQLWHIGAVASPMTDWTPGQLESPSGLFAPDIPRGVTMDEEAIADSIASFARAAVDAKRLGFDTIEMHGAHGYLIDQFFWPGTNRRDDLYGGTTIEERNRFAVETIRAVRQSVGPDFPIILRVSQWKQQDFTVRIAQTPDEMTTWLGPLVDAGVDILHCSQRRFWEPEFPELDGPEGLNMAGWAKKLTGAATISVGSVGLSRDIVEAFVGETAQPASLDGVVARMERGEFDLIAIGRAILGDPRWVTKIREGEHAKLQPFAAETMGAWRHSVDPAIRAVPGAPNQANHDV